MYCLSADILSTRHGYRKDVRMSSRQPSVNDFGLIYRPQGMTFGEIEEALPYFQQLGVGAVYFGPIFEAASDHDPNNRHGYDAISDRISPARGGRRGFDSLMAAIRKAGMAAILDFVVHHTSDQHIWTKERPELYDTYQLPGNSQTHWANFFGYSWLPRLAQDWSSQREAHRAFLEIVEQYNPYVRVDHPDGMINPRMSIAMLRDAGAPGIWGEKISIGGECFPRTRGYLGGVGYWTSYLSTALMHEQAGVDGITADWRQVAVSSGVPYQSVKESDFDCRRKVVRDFSAPIQRAIAGLDPGSPQLTLSDVALMLATCPGYRTYLEPGEAADVCETAKLDAMTMPTWLREDLKAGKHAEFTRNVQPIMAAVKAKGTEDWRYFLWLAVLGLNDVGCGHRALGPENFIQEVLKRNETYPHDMWDTNTHDSKQSAFLRAMHAWTTHDPRQYIATVKRLVDLMRRDLGNDGNMLAARFIIETVLSMYPIGVNVQDGENDRLLRYFSHAFRHGRLYTNWVERNSEWEEGWMYPFVAKVCNDSMMHAAMKDYAEAMFYNGWELNLSMELLKMICSRKPVLYHGSELPVRRLMDPDNRGPVNYRRLGTMLEALQGGGPVHSGNCLLNLIWRCQQAIATYGCQNSSIEFVDDLPPGIVGVRRGPLVALVSHRLNRHARAPRFKDHHDLLNNRYPHQALYYVS